MPEPLKERTKQFALEVIRYFVRLPRDEAARVLGRQLLRSETNLIAIFVTVVKTAKDR